MNTAMIFRAIDNLPPSTREQLLGRIAQMLVETLAGGQRSAGPRGRPPRANKPDPQTPRTTATEDDVLAYVKANPDQRTEDIAAALGSDVKAALRKLREAKMIRTKGQKRAMSYSAAGSTKG